MSQIYGMAAKHVFDVAIVGGGMVGAALAAALSKWMVRGGGRIAATRHQAPPPAIAGGCQPPLPKALPGVHADRPHLPLLQAPTR